MKHLLGLAAFSAFLLAAPAAQSAPLHFMATLDGASENPPNASPATGTAHVIFDDMAMTLAIESTFMDLTGTTTLAHIHCCVAPPGAAGPATETPTLSTFPVGVTAGNYMDIYDLTDAGTYSAAFLTASGGTPAGAAAALLAGLQGGMAYFNIHTSAFGGGEIRGFFAPLVVDPIPEPATLALVGAGLAGAFAVRRRAKK